MFILQVSVERIKEYVELPQVSLAFVSQAKSLNIQSWNICFDWAGSGMGD
jgi:hypothetical protein